MKKLYFAVVLIYTVCFITVSCSISNEYPKNQYESSSSDLKSIEYDITDKGPVKGGRLRLFATTPDSLNPLITKNKYIFEYLSFIYEPMVKIGKDQKPIPVLAERWEVSDDDMVWTFYLRDGVFWHDGTPFTSEDVEFTFETILNNNQNSFYKSNMQNIATFAAISRDTFRVVLKKPNSFTADLMCFPVIPRHIFSGMDLLQEASNMTAIGTGPFKFESYIPDKSINLSANNSWWNSASGLDEIPEAPYIDAVEIIIYENARDEIAAFQSGEIDFVHFEDADYSKYSERFDLIIREYVSGNFEFLAFNLSTPVFMEKEVRQAIAYAIDKSEIIKTVLAGRAIPSDVPLIPGTWLNDGSETSYDKNNKKACTILLENGWEMKNGFFYKNIRGAEKRLEFEILVNLDNAARKEIARNIAEQLEEVGIAAIVCELDWKEEMNRINNGKFDTAILGCTVPAIPDISYLYSSSYIFTYHTEGNWPAWNISGYYNESVNNYNSRLFSEYDYERRKALFSDARKVLIDDVPYLGLFFYKSAAIYNKGIRGSIEPYVWDKFNKFTEWYMAQNWK